MIVMILVLFFVGIFGLGILVAPWYMLGREHGAGKERKRQAKGAAGGGNPSQFPQGMAVVQAPANSQQGPLQLLQRRGAGQTGVIGTIASYAGKALLMSAGGLGMLWGGKLLLPILLGPEDDPTQAGSFIQHLLGSGATIITDLSQLPGEAQNFLEDLVPHFGFGSDEAAATGAIATTGWPTGQAGVVQPAGLLTDNGGGSDALTYVDAPILPSDGGSVAGAYAGGGE